MNFFKNNIDKSLEKILNSFLSKIHFGKLEVQFPSGQKKLFIGVEDGYFATLKIYNYKFLSLIFKKGSIGFAEAYIKGFYSTNNLTNLLMLSHKNENYFLDDKKTNLFFSIYNKIRHILNENTKSQSKKNIKHHYDLGNKFYEKWLDQSMTYSSALFDQNNTSLSDAQLNKYKKIADTLSLNENSKTLEIGCGWGGFSSFIAKNYKCKVDAITISKEQFEFTSNKIQSEGLSEKVSVQFKDYRDVNTKYSNIASIEMFEAVGKKYWNNYFNILNNALSNNGKAAIQVITIDEKRSLEYQRTPDFIQQYIFPGGMLPTKNQLEQNAKNVGMKFIELLSFGKSYAKTLNLWNEQFQQSWEDVSKFGFDHRFKRMWEFYLSYCETGFLSKSTDVSHFLVKK
tara:strand:- start:918 stop:2111 length:1194 start_codon:yes stop_codon:yes gene_type:complete